MKYFAKIRKRRRADKHHKSWYYHDLKFVDQIELPELTEEEKETIRSVWPSLEWKEEDYLQYRAYKKLRGFSPYFVGGYQSSSVWKALNPRELSVSLANKAYMDFIYPELPFPQTFLRGITGNIYDANMNFLTLEEGVNLLLEHRDFIIKPSVDSAYGNKVEKISLPSDCDEAKGMIKDAIRNIGSNFVVQEVLKQHPIMATLNPTSINSCRFTSMYIDGRYGVSVALRFGKKGSHIDNWSKGYFVGVTSDGVLNDIGYDIHLNTIKETDMHVAFGGMRVPSFEKMAELVEYAHKKYFPMCGVIGWDMMVDSEGAPHIIEYNLRPDFFAEQLCSGTFFEPFCDVIGRKIQML